MCFHSVKQRSREGLQAARQELEDREKVREELQGIRVWLKAAASLLTEMEQSSSTQELQVRLLSSCFSELHHTCTRFCGVP